jgi:hypothetical protein
MNQFRAGVRVPLELPVHIRWKSRTGIRREARGTTANISGNGLSVKAPIRVGHRTPITLTVILPADVTRTPLELFCQGRVVWRDAKLPGIGATIEDYQLRPARHPA